MIYKFIALAELETLLRENKEMSLGQAIYSFSRLRDKKEDLKTFLLNVTDEDIYSLIQNSRIYEREV